MISKRLRKTLWILVPAIILVVTFVGLPAQDVQADCSGIDSAVVRLDSASGVGTRIISSLKSFIQPLSAQAWCWPWAPTKPASATKDMVPNCVWEDEYTVSLSKDQYLQITNTCNTDQFVQVYDTQHANWNFTVKAGKQKNISCSYQTTLTFLLGPLSGSSFVMECSG